MTPSPAMTLRLSTTASTWVGLILVVATFVAIRALGAALELPRPGQLAVVAAALVAWFLCRRAGVTLAAIGYGRPSGVLRTVLPAIALYLVATLSIVVIVLPLSRALSMPPMQLESFGDLRGNLPRLLALLALVWTTVAFGEEFVFRGFLQKGLAGALGGSRASPTVIAGVSIAGQALVFGALHGYLGPTGMLNAAVIGLVFGVGAHLTRGNLWPLTIAHGLIDSISLTALYAGVMPH